MKEFFSLRLVVLILTFPMVQAQATVPLEQSYTEQQIVEFKKKSSQGDIEAQKRLALAYLRGLRPLQQDDKEAFKYFKLAADAGDAWSQTYVGWFYEKGKTVEQNYNAALEWYHLAEAQGFPYAQDRIGKMYRDGRGVSTSYPLAADFFKKAALQFQGMAASHLGALYATGGPDWPQDYEKAFFWLDIGENPSWSKVLLVGDELCCEDEDYKPPHYYLEVQKHLTSEQIKKIRQQVKDYKMPPRSKWSPPFIPAFTPPTTHKNSLDP